MQLNRFFQVCRINVDRPRSTDCWRRIGSFSAILQQLSFQIVGHPVDVIAKPHEESSNCDGKRKVPNNANKFEHQITIKAAVFVVIDQGTATNKVFFVPIFRIDFK